jgi:hydroxymethylpyrimidine pyrophosphatase-like HAD family hydrolase
MKVNGIIALDIDGTVADETHAIPPNVCEFLTGLSKEWAIVFITGRTFAYGYSALKTLNFPYYFCVFNGAIMLKMPERQEVRRHDFPLGLVPKIEQVCAAHGTDPFFHEEHRAYWRPSRHDPLTRGYLERRHAATTEDWEEVEDFLSIGQNRLCYAKIFATKAVLGQVEIDLHSQMEVSTSVITDSLHPDHGIMLVTHPMATKGGALRDMRALMPPGIPAIAAGDERNDVTMIEEADIGILMETAPDDIKGLADIVTGDIIEGLREAIDDWTYRT